MRTRIKFCGCTSSRDVESAVEMGVDAIGVIFAAGSPRAVDAVRAAEIARAVPAFVALVGVFVEPAPAHVAEARAAGFLPQFSGEEPASLCESGGGAPYIKVFHLAPGGEAPVDPTVFARHAAPYRHATWMVDTVVNGKRGGTGRTFDWDRIGAVARDRRLIVSGGLTPDNVAACVRRLRPFGVDVRSGIETDGVKDLAKMRAFVRAVKEADEQA